MNTNDIVYVTYTAYEKGSPNVVSEGVIPLHGCTTWQAEQTVKAMFSTLDVSIRSSSRV